MESPSRKSYVGGTRGDLVARSEARIGGESFSAEILRRNTRGSDLLKEAIASVAGISIDGEEG